jgi:5-formyltetrahydrofolate cyclo-ligase
MSKDIWTVGVGFKEQLCEELLPIDPWDVPVKELMLI